MNEDLCEFCGMTAAWHRIRRHQDRLVALCPVEDELVVKAVRGVEYTEKTGRYVGTVLPKQYVSPNLAGLVLQDLVWALR